MTPITVIHAHAQLLERWARRTEPEGGELVLTRLSVITTMVWRLVVQLDALREAESAESHPE